MFVAGNPPPVPRDSQEAFSFLGGLPPVSSDPPPSKSINPAVSPLLKTLQWSSPCSQNETHPWHGCLVSQGLCRPCPSPWPSPLKLTALCPLHTSHTSSCPTPWPTPPHPSDLSSNVTSSQRPSLIISSKDGRLCVCCLESRHDPLTIKFTFLKYATRCSRYSHKVMPTMPL